MKILLRNSADIIFSTLIGICVTILTNDTVGSMILTLVIFLACILSRIEYKIEKLIKLLEEKEK